jgi:hypothetical protein
MRHNDPLSELWQIKEKISVQFSTARELVAEADRIAKEEPLPPPGRTRKMIADFPRGQSVADDDEITRELRQVREKLLEEAGGDLGKLSERADREGPLVPAPFRKTAEDRARAVAQKEAARSRLRKPLKRNPKASGFRTLKGKAAAKHRGN